MLRRSTWGPGPVERPAEVVHGPVVAGDAHRVADDPVLAGRLAGADRGDADRRAGGEAGADRATPVAGGEAGEEGSVLRVVANEVPAEAVDEKQAGVADRREVERVGMARQAEGRQHGRREVAEGGLPVEGTSGVGAISCSAYRSEFSEKRSRGGVVLLIRTCLRQPVEVGFKMDSRDERRAAVKGRGDREGGRDLGGLARLPGRRGRRRAGGAEGLRRLDAGGGGRPRRPLAGLGGRADARRPRRRANRAASTSTPGTPSGRRRTGASASSRRWSVRTAPGRRSARGPRPSPRRGGGGWSAPSSPPTPGSTTRSTSPGAYPPGVTARPLGGHRAADLARPVALRARLALGVELELVGGWTRRAWWQVGRQKMCVVRLPKKRTRARASRSISAGSTPSAARICFFASVPPAP